MAKIDLPEMPVKTVEKEYVDIPQRDIFDMPFPNISIGEHKYEAGQKHYVDAQVAFTLKDRIRAVERANIRLMQPRKDANAEATVARENNRGGAITTNF